MNLLEQLRKIKSSRKAHIMSVVSLTKFNDKDNELKSEFEKKFEENEVSGSSNKLSEYKFLTILGQGAFGVVVI